MQIHMANVEVVVAYFYFAFGISFSCFYATQFGAHR